MNRLIEKLKTHFMEEYYVKLNINAKNNNLFVRLAYPSEENYDWYFSIIENYLSNEMIEDKYLLDGDYEGVIEIRSV